MEKGQKDLSICGKDSSLEFHDFNASSHFQCVDYQGGASLATGLTDGGTGLRGVPLIIREVQK